MQYIAGIVKELLALFRLSKENKFKEVELKNQEDFKDREKKQQEVLVKDGHDELIAQVVNAQTEEEKKAKLGEIRKIISR
jgi:putative cell wall-binding protein